MLWVCFKEPRSLLHTSRDKLQVSLASFTEVYKKFGDNSCLTLCWAWSRKVKQDRQCTYNVIFRRVRATIVAVGKQWVEHNLSVCVCSLSYPACKDILSSVTCPAPQYFSTLSHKRHDFRKKKRELLNTKCVFWFSLQLLSVTFLILRRNERYMIKNFTVLGPRIVIYLLFVLIT
jgi:hypothetical protein